MSPCALLDYDVAKYYYASQILTSPAKITWFWRWS